MATKANYALVRVNGVGAPTGIVAGFSTPEHARYWANHGYGFHRPDGGKLTVLEIENMTASELSESLKEQLANAAEQEAEQRRIGEERAAKAEEEARQRAIAEAVEQKRREADLAQITKWRRQAEAEYEKSK